MPGNQVVDVLAGDPGRNGGRHGKAAADLLHVLAMTVHHQAGPAELTGEKRAVSAAQSGSDFNKAAGGAAGLVQERQRQPILLILRTEPEPLGGEALGVWQRRRVDIVRPQQGPNGRLQVSRTKPDLVQRLALRLEPLERRRLICASCSACRAPVSTFLIRLRRPMLLRFGLEDALGVLPGSNQVGQRIRESRR